jgi:hypothetical protein
MKPGISVLRSLITVGLAVLSAAPYARSANLTLSAGVFYFNATDYYYPNFYDAIGFRGEIGFAPSSEGPSAARLQLYGYPGDDNIFEGILEYGYVFRLVSAGWRLRAGPAGGFGITKFQYPVPYFPVVQHQYLGWWRFGYDVTFGRAWGERFSWAVGDRGRLLFAGAGGTYTLAHNRLHRQNAPFLELAWRRPAPPFFFVRAGVEVGGYYDDVFLPKEKKLRPFAEAGFAYSF